MRPAAVILVWIALLGGLWAYMQTRWWLVPPPSIVFEVQPAPGRFTLEVTPTFDAQGGVDEFALEPVPQPAFVLSLNGSEIARHKQTVRAGIPVNIAWNLRQAPLEVGKNEFHIQLATPDGDPQAVRGVRLRLLRDDAEVETQTLWSEPGRPVDGVVRFNIDADDAKHTEHHDDT